MRIVKLTRLQQVAILVMAVPSIASLFLLALRIVITSTFDFGFMPWNLTLSVSAVAAAWGCSYVWRNRITKWWRTFTVALFLAWLFLLPNTFYMLTDLIHLGETADINLLYDVVMLSLFAFAGFIQGCIALWTIHTLLIKRFGTLNAHILIGMAMLASSFAVDMGRYLRWNSWDVLLHPQSIIFDLTDTFLNPLNYNRSFLVTGVFFVATVATYVPFWYTMSLIKRRDTVE